MSAAYFEHLAGARGIAAAVVCLSHVIQIQFLRFTGLGTSLHKTSSIASEYAVLVFFVLSGYLITHALETNIQKNGYLRLNRFIAARVARIYPPFLFAVLISVVIFMILDGFNLPGRESPFGAPSDLYAARDRINLSASEVKDALLMKQGMLEINGPLWSLYIEVKLYILFACALALLDKYPNFFRKIFIAIIFFLVARSGLINNPGFAPYAAIWLVGSASYYLWSGPERPANRLLFCACAIIASIFSEAWRTASDVAALLNCVRDLTIAAAAGWLLFKIRIPVPNFRPLADCSYSLYVTHFPLLIMVQSLLIFLGHNSIEGAVVGAVIGVVLVGAVARVGGAIEAEKSTIQSALLNLAERMNRKGPTGS